MGPHLLYPRLVSPNGVVALQIGYIIKHRKKNYTTLALLEDRKGPKLLAVASSNYKSQPKVLSLGSCQVVSTDPSELSTVTDCLQQWMDEHKENCIVKASPGVKKLERKRRRTQPFDEQATKPKAKHKPAMVQERPKKKIKLVQGPSVEDLPAEPVLLKTLHIPRTVDPTPTPSLHAVSMTSQLALRLSLEKRELQQVQHQILQNELHSQAEHERIQQQINEQRLRSLENEQLLLQAVLYGGASSLEKL